MDKTKKPHTTVNVDAELIEQARELYDNPPASLILARYINGLVRKDLEKAAKKEGK